MAGAVSERLEVGELDRLGIDTVIIAGTDIQGRMFGKRMSPRVFATKLEEGLHICTCVYAWDMAQALEGLHVEFAGGHTGWHDFALIPDLSTLRPAAWLERTAICLADCVDERDGAPLAIAPRTILRLQIDALAARDLQAFTATELEFYLFRGTPGDLRAGGYRSLAPTTDVHADYNITEGNAMEPFFRGLRNALDASGVPVDVAQVEYGLGQWEINLEYAGALEMADRHVLYKQAVKDYATQHGYTATFMPRPMTDDLGSSCHIHTSLRDGSGAPVFHDANGDRGVSEVLRHAVGGVLSHAPELMCWYAPTINSYRRTGSQDFAGNGLTWGFDNRTVTTRVLSGGAPAATRFEFRLPGADVNPYLALAGVLASVIDGVDRSVDPGPPSAGDAYAGDQAGLPSTLLAAAEGFLNSEFAAKAFGGDVVTHYHALADYEWHTFMRSVTDWERERYLDSI
ncbi:MAG TPA: glutamine synthetase family protein [Candidatus Acidoferrales bacterium]|nr:glutamine synthetase family protein [Candidatus Acidoferrales bacterium]